MWERLVGQPGWPLWPARVVPWWADGMMVEMYVRNGMRMRTEAEEDEAVRRRRAFGVPHYRDP